LSLFNKLNFPLSLQGKLHVLLLAVLLTTLRDFLVLYSRFGQVACVHAYMFWSIDYKLHLGTAIEWVH